MHTADTSFLCALYRQQVNSEQAITAFESLGTPLVISPLLAFEFRQSVRFQMFLRSRDAAKGYLEADGLRMLADFESDVESGALMVLECHWPDVAGEAERLSERHTQRRGARAFDLLHIATALRWQASAFLSFDGLQREIAVAEGLAVFPQTLP